ncbi:hypothetical protein QYM36_009083 [Artemia franciscana]|uniref:Uncharacterized protein n=1 Tax=Artemia franciscana TaxID=6661 RepID=A0AA88HPB7_ARTSF|nr:hypothetical protein QYM36_009083 [Artemia franciscana]
MVSDIPPGLASTQAFNVLIEDIKKTLDEMEACRPYFTYESLIAEVVFLLFLFIGNVTFKLWDSKIKHKEIIERTKFITKYLEDCSKISKWDEKNYPNLCSPLSPSIVLQPTLRDGKLVNVPWALLVRGDCVQLRPGQPIPAKCRSYQDNEEDVKNFEYNEVYSPSPDKNPAVDIRQCEPLQHIYCVLEETPYIRNLKVFVQKSCKRPTSSVEKERYLLFIMTMEHFGIPIAVVSFQNLL